MKKLESLVKDKLIPAITGKKIISEEMRLVFSLPARLGGLGFQNPGMEADFEFYYSMRATSQLKDAIKTQRQEFQNDEERQKDILAQIKQAKTERANEILREVKDKCSATLFKLIELSSEKGASSWLTSLPLKDYGFRLNKQEFTDAIAMRYDLKINDVSRTCVCGQPNTTNQSILQKRWFH